MFLIDVGLFMIFTKGTFDWADRPPRNLTVGELKVQEIPKPGEAYEYNDVRVNLLSFSLLNVLKEPLPHILKTELMDPIGASNSWRWYGYENSWINLDGVMTQSVSGGGHNGGGIFINSEDHARFGLLYLNDGVWDNKRIISKEWIDKSLNPSTPNPEYGFMWWLNTEWNNLPDNLYYGSGFGGNYIVVIPDENMVVVGRWLGRNTIGNFIEMILKSK